MMASALLQILLMIVLLTASALAAGEPRRLSWTPLQRGVEYAAPRVTIKLPIKVKDDRLHIVRVDPRLARLKALVSSALDRRTRTARQWARQHRLSVAINLGMYLDDYLTHVGYLRLGKHVNSRGWVSKYRSVLVLNQGRGKAAPRMIDLESKGVRAGMKRYELAVQNLRLIKAQGAVGKETGKGVWSRQAKRWSEAAVAMDTRGRLLFIFCRAPLTMWEFNNFILSLPLGVIRAMHMEGGPEASLSIHTKRINLDLHGSFETGFFTHDGNDRQWALPNVLGVSRR